MRQDTRLAGATVDVEFVGADGVVRRGPLAQCWSMRFEEVAPVRSFLSYRGQRNFPGWWWSSSTLPPALPALRRTPSR